MNDKELDEILEDIYESLATEDTGMDLDYFLEDTRFKQAILDWHTSLCDCCDESDYYDENR